MGFLIAVVGGVNYGPATIMAMLRSWSRWLSVAALTALVCIAGCRRATRNEGEKPVPAAPQESCSAGGWCVQVAPTKLRGVWAASSRDVWGVSNAVLHWNGTRWNEAKDLPAVKGGKPRLLRAVHGSSAHAVWAVGSEQSLFWDGQKFAAFALPLDGSAVFTIAADDAWAVSDAGLSAHWDGQTWSLVATPAEALTSLYCAAKNDCWAAGSKELDYVEPEDIGTVLHWDGSKWKRQALRLPGVRAVGGTASDDVWAVGAWGRIFHFDGKRWSPSSSHARRTLYGVQAVARNDVWVTGDDGLVLHFDGNAWSAGKAPWPRLETFTAASDRELWGLNGTILHWRAAAFRPEPVSKDLWDEATLTPSAADLEAGERAKVLSYLRDMALGRVSTRAGHFEAAQEAFSRALTMKPEDARAYSERGYAAYLAKEYDKARDDLRQAAERTKERVLRAQIFFNLGLVHEALKTDATAAFALSNFLRPTVAVQKKLAGKSSCPVGIARGASPIERNKYRDWLEFFAKASLRVDGKPTTNEAAKALLCAAGFAGSTQTCQGPQPWIVTDNWLNAYLVRDNAGGLEVATVANSSSTGGFCPNATGAEVVFRTKELIVLRETGGFGATGTECETTDDDGSRRACTDEEFSHLHEEGQARLQWVRTCEWHGYINYQVLDLETWEVQLTVTQDEATTEGMEGSEVLKVSVDDRGITLKAPGCSEVLPVTLLKP